MVTNLKNKVLRFFLTLEIYFKDLEGVRGIGVLDPREINGEVWRLTILKCWARI